MWRSIVSVGVMIYRREPELRFLLHIDGDITTIPSTQFVREGKEGLGALGLLRTIGMDDEARVPVDMDHELIYYADETKYNEKMFAVEVGTGAEPEGDSNYRWRSFEEALRLLTLASHKKALIKLLSEVIDIDAPLAHPSLTEFDHVPVDHPSGLVVLSDFDGTITIGEPSISILKTFAPRKWEIYENAWLAGELTTHECLGYQFTIIDSPMNELVQFAAENGIVRNGVKEFMAWCNEKGHGLAITSVGIDFYISTILERNGLGSIPFISNRSHWVKERGLIIEEGMVNPDCRDCSNCKTLLVELYQARGAKVAFVGDGITDKCPAERADIVFARKELLEHCKGMGLDSIPFESFDDVRRGLEDLGH